MQMILIELKICIFTQNMYIYIFHDCLNDSVCLIIMSDSLNELIKNEEIKSRDSQMD